MLLASPSIERVSLSTPLPTKHAADPLLCVYHVVIYGERAAAPKIPTPIICLQTL